MKLILLLSLVAQTPTVVRPADIAWQPAPPVLEPGAQASILSGTPGQPGLLTIRVRVPDKYRIAPHRHPVDEHVTVLSGTMCLTIDDRSSPTCLGAGGFALIPANTPHSVSISGATEYQIHVIGMFAMEYLNAADDPSKRPR